MTVLALYTAFSWLPTMLTGEGLSRPSPVRV